jgi:hypothetical protein
VRSDAKGFGVKFNEPIEELTGSRGRVAKIVHEANRPS